MRCKNCGTYNDDNRYICETCGSPLYDEEEIQASPANDSDTMPQFNTAPESLQPNTDSSPQEISHQLDKAERNPAEKKSVIVIAILTVVLVAIIASVAVVAHSKSKDNETTTSESSATHTTSQHATTKSRTERTTEPDTTEEATTTTTTTTTTTQAQTWYINANTAGGGKVKGGGEYKNGDKVTVSATADSGYVFDGWYSNGMKISSSAKYTFIANENISLSAVFIGNEPTTDEVIENGEVEDINFGG